MSSRKEGPKKRGRGFVKKLIVDTDKAKEMNWPAPQIGKRSKPSLIPAERLRLLRHFRFTRIKVLLSQLTVVGGGKTKLAFVASGEDRVSRH